MTRGLAQNEHFWGFFHRTPLSHRYAMVLHDPATDPKHEKTESGKNPHVHLVVKAVGENGERLYIRKDTLQAWREQFAHALREQGVEANATPAALRGKAKSSAKGAIHQHQERIEKWRTEPQEERNKQKKPIPSVLLERSQPGIRIYQKSTTRENRS